MENIFKRTHMCGILSLDNNNDKVVLNGWINKKRNLGSLIFCDLRDKTGIVQIVFNDDVDEKVFKKADTLRSEFVVGIKGTVKERESKNNDIKTGAIEVIVEDLIIYSKAETPPIYIKDDDNVDDNLRLKYRYLDLRKNKMQRNLTFRHNIAKIAREYFDQEGFTEVETPILIKPTPEGARDYLVPSRVNSGEFYALPQSPQMFKQLLMVAGTDRYMQITKCFRDEDLRADRQPEFTQIDLEMSFVDIDDVIKIQEGFIKEIMSRLMNVEIKLPFERLTYDEAMNRFGSDKPDTRFGYELHDISDVVKNCNFKVFTDAIELGGDVRGINIDGGAKEFSRKDIDKLTVDAKQYGAKGLVWIKLEKDEIKSSVNKFFTQEELQSIANIFDAKNDDLIFIVSDKKKIVYDTLGFLRRHIADKMGLLDNEKYNFLWVVDFPLFEYDEDTDSYAAMHHPFTAPIKGDENLLIKEPQKVKAKAYDIVLNGVELGGGSIRIHDKETQENMFRALGISDEESENKFGFLLEAFKYGVPPHGGIAYGLDRLAMLLLGENSIREVMAFPKNQSAQCMVCDAPTKVTNEQLSELNLNIK